MYTYPITDRQSPEEGILGLGLEVESLAEAGNRQLWR